MRVSPLLLLVVIVASCLSDALAAELEKDERDIVVKLIKNVEKRIDPPAPFQPVDAGFVSGRRVWLKRTINRLETYIADHRGDMEVETWNDLLPLGEIRAELSRATPDAALLKQIYNEDTLRAFRKIQQDCDQEGPDAYYGKKHYLGYHAIASLFRALNRYAVSLDDQRHPDQAQARLTDHLRETRLFLSQYRDSDNEEVRLQAIKAVHSVLNDIEVTRQEGKLVEDIRSYYLHPKLRVFISTDVLTHVVGLFPLDPQSVTQRQKGTYIHGVGTPVGSLFVEGHASDAMGILEARYAGPVVFRGSAHRKHINLGISATLSASLQKRLYVIQGAPDSASARSTIRLLSTGSSGGPLVDRFVDTAAQRAFNSARISAVLNKSVDAAVTQAANYINAGVAQGVARRLKKLGKDITHARAYRSRANGIELTLLSARQGFKQPDDEQRRPDFFGPDSQDIDFAFCVRKGVIRELIGGPGQEDRLTVERVTEMVKRGLEFLQEGTLEGESLVLRFPDDGQFITHRKGAGGDTTIGLAFQVADADTPNQFFPATVEVRHSQLENGQLFEFSAKVPNQPALDAKFKATLARFSRLNRIMLPNLENLPPPDERLAVKNLKLVFGDDSDYVTVSGEFTTESSPDRSLVRPIHGSADCR